VKVALSISNVREAFFQTVSNSSWANYAYLVASSLDAKAKDELELLSEAHGIGFYLYSQIRQKVMKASDISFGPLTST
jgi:hypothetical protein